APATTLRSLPPHGILALFTHLLILFSSNTVAQSISNGSEVDRQALLSFKSSISSDPRGVLSSWSTSTSFCSWRGVTCGITLPTRVVSLNLNSRELTGQLSPWIANLTSLEQLDLSENLFSGGIPEELGTLQQLQFMILSTNNLVGTIPRSLGTSRSLKNVDLSSNQLVGPILGFHKRSNLQFLDLSSNNLSGSIPSSLGNVSSLTYICLDTNMLSGSVPETLSLIQNLRMLSLSNNYLSGHVSAKLCNMSSLIYLRLDQNNLTGRVPSCIGNTLQNLKLLSMSGNNFEGLIPSSLANASNLRWIDLGHNLLEGRIPSLGSLSNLTFLNLESNFLQAEGNKFSGQIPSTIGNLSRLNKLYLHNNELTGNIPATLGNCKQLYMLELYFNSLEGPIPSELFSSTTLIGLDLSNNYLTGSIPLQIGGLLQLLRLDISFNKLSGQVPLTFGECVQLSSLRLRSNMLTGSIPRSFSNLKSIEQIDLSQNSLVGKIPEFFANMDYLQQLYLSMNYFEGPIPTGGIFQNHSAVNLEGNDELCASAATTLYQFPVCTTTSAVGSKKNALLLVKVIPPVAIALISFIYFVVTLLKRRQAETITCYKETMKKISYGDIVKATNWLSPINKISSSRTGSIYIGRFEFDTDLVAIKLFHLEENGVHDSFATECEVLRNTRHRNLVKAVTVCSTVDLENNEFKAIVFDFMANGSLDMWVHPKLHNNSPKRVLSLGQRLRIAMDVALALDYMHNQLTPPLIHCDLKPGNVLLDYDMTARVGDFGSARFLSSTPGSPEDLVGVEGTIGYIAPEYCMGYKVSPGCDVYGFGILLLEMLTGRRPTDAMFTGGLSLHKLVSSAFPGRLREVLDPHLSHEQQRACDRVLMRRYMVPLVEVGLLCSTESPKDRPGMGEVCARILCLKEAFFEFC
uniref:non-specific serine/threonine protein kinase n=1 Tax=Aegilops tauschii subsp. strangulata TaxID=200361 RepID=A0A453AGR7_AEGTS